MSDKTTLAEDVAEYREHMTQVLHFGAVYARLFEEIPLEKMERSVRNAIDFGPFVDPTKYMEALGDRRLEKQLAAIRAVRTFLASWRDAGLPKLEEQP